MSTDVEIEKLSAGDGAGWISQGFGLFKQSAGVWIGLILVWFLIQVVANLVPLGGLVMTILSPVFTAGILFGCRDLEADKPLQLNHLFAGFRSERSGPLILLGVLSLVLYIVAVIVIAGLAFAFIGSVDFEAPQVNEGAVGMLVIIAMLVFLPVLLAVWFATPLVALHEMDALAAFRASFRACLRNIGALTVYSLLLLPLSMLALLPLGLGLLVLVPTFMAANYRAYREIFPLQEEEAQIGFG